MRASWIGPNGIPLIAVKGPASALCCCGTTLRRVSRAVNSSCRLDRASSEGRAALAGLPERFGHATEYFLGWWCKSGDPACDTPSSEWRELNTEARSAAARGAKVYALDRWASGWTQRWEVGLKYDTFGFGRCDATEIAALPDDVLAERFYARRFKHPIRYMAPKRTGSEHGISGPPVCAVYLDYTQSRTYDGSFSLANRDQLYLPRIVGASQTYVHTYRIATGDNDDTRLINFFMQSCRDNLCATDPSCIRIGGALARQSARQGVNYCAKVREDYSMRRVPPEQRTLGGPYRFLLQTPKDSDPHSNVSVNSNMGQPAALEFFSKTCRL